MTDALTERWTDQALTMPSGSRRDVDKFRKELTEIVNHFDEWPRRPMINRTECYEKAAFIVYDGNQIFPIFNDDEKINLAGVIGYDEREYDGAKRLLANTK